jgi:hypothetical protein
LLHPIDRRWRIAESTAVRPFLSSCKDPQRAVKALAEILKILRDPSPFLAEPWGSELQLTAASAIAPQQSPSIVDVIEPNDVVLA